MAAATDAQVQQWANERARVRAEQIRALKMALESDTGTSYESVFQALNIAEPTWADNRADGPPNLLTPNDLLSINAFCANLLAWIEANGDYAAIQKACVRPVNG